MNWLPQTAHETSTCMSFGCPGRAAPPRSCEWEWRPVSQGLHPAASASAAAVGQPLTPRSWPSSQVWDLGGQVSLRLSWAAYYASTDAVIVVVDSTDRARMGIARQELANILASPQLAGACILVFANKQVR